MIEPNITCAYCKHRHPRGMPCAIASRQAQNAAMERIAAQAAFAGAHIQQALEEAVLGAFRDLYARGNGVIRIALIHDEITITKEDHYT